MILFRIYIEVGDQSIAETTAYDYLQLLNRVGQFKVKLVQPYWKINGQYEVLLESMSHDYKVTISDLMSLIKVSPQHFSETEVIWSDVTNNFPLFGAKWAHAELV